jgi:FKBP-type peptidyl-prolyl cis-trans isomerase SlyD
MNTEIVRKDKLVSFSYSILNVSGQVVEHNDLPISYIHGRETEIFPQVIAALEGHVAGDEVTIELKPEDAFGARDPNLTFSDDIQNAPPEVHFVGAEIEAQNDRGEIRQFRVIGIDNGRITVDANHPLAGEVVIFRVTVKEVRDPQPHELGADAPPSLH